MAGLADASRGTHLNGALMDILAPKRKNRWRRRGGWGEAGNGSNTTKSKSSHGTGKEERFGMEREHRKLLSDRVCQCGTKKIKNKKSRKEKNDD